jgi:hypothetical protein
MSETTRCCFCKICQFGRQVELVRNYGNTAAKQQLIDELYERLASAEDDNCHWQGIRAGTWPNARLVAEDIIRRCDALGSVNNA